MRIKLIPFLLALSLGFNIFCLGGYLAGRKQAQQIQPPQKPLERLFKHLKLQPEQQQEMTRLIESGRHEFQRLQEERRADVRWFRDELNQLQPDIEAMRRLMRQNEHRRQKARQLNMQRWRNFLARLTLSQKQKIISLVRRRPRLRRQLMLPPRLLDANEVPEHRRFKEPGPQQQ